MSDVFVSYAREDKEPARTVADALAHQGFSIWFDEKTTPGKAWDEVIGRELDNARCVVVLWSEASIKSRWVKEEAGRAADRNCLVPVLIETVTPPFGFRSIQAADLSEWHGDAAAPQ